MTNSGAESGASSPSKGPPKKIVTLEILLNLLQARGLSDTAECLKKEAGFTPKGESSIENVAPVTEEALRLRSHAASLSQTEQRRRIASLAQEMSKQGQQMAEIRDLVHRVRSGSGTVSRPSLEEQEEQIKRNDVEIRELEIVCSERDTFGRNLRSELEHTSAEVAELRRTLEEREDEETQARMRLLKLEEEAMKLTAQLDAVPAQTQARKIQALLSGWYDADGHLQVMIRQIFMEIDRDRDGRLEWNNNEIRNFVHELFHRNGILLPNWQEHVWYEMYRRADVDGSYSLELDEAMRFARSCFEAALALVLTGQSENSTDATVMGEWWTRTHMAPVKNQAMTYSSGVVIDFTEHSVHFARVIEANSAHRLRMVRIIESGEHLKSTMRTYRECDKDGNGRLTWNNGEIRNFISACFRQHALVPPDEEHIYALYSKFDTDSNHALDMRECLEMIDALFRTTFIVEAGSIKTVAPAQSGVTYVSPAVVRAGSPHAGIKVVQAKPRVVSPGPSRVAKVISASGTASPRSKDLFDQIDANHDGVISRGEFEKAMEARSHGASHGGSLSGSIIAGGHARGVSPTNVVYNRQGARHSGSPTPLSTLGGATPIMRMNSNGRAHSPGVPLVVPGSPRQRAHSPGGSIVVVQAQARGISPGPPRSGLVSPAISQTGSHVAVGMVGSQQRLHMTGAQPIQVNRASPRTLGNLGLRR